MKWNQESEGRIIMSLAPNLELISGGLIFQVLMVLLQDLAL